MSDSPIVHGDPEIGSGEPVFVGTRVPVRNLLDWIEGGHTLDEFLDNFPLRDARSGSRIPGAGRRRVPVAPSRWRLSRISTPGW
jgi:hypothetical protein